MEERKNCWEFFKCGREPGGTKVEELGVCPVTVHESSDGINHGRAAGRQCWAVEDNTCYRTIGAKFKDCMKCSFYQEVESHEGRHFILGLGKR